MSDAPKSPPESSGSASESGGLPKLSPNQAKNDWPVTLALLGRIVGIGWFVGTSISLGAYCGYWFDRQFETAPVLTIVGLSLGVVTAFVGMFRLLNAIRKGR